MTHDRAAETSVELREFSAHSHTVCEVSGRKLNVL
jgi:hypothetical protein